MTIKNHPCVLKQKEINKTIINNLKTWEPDEEYGRKLSTHLLTNSSKGGDFVAKEMQKILLTEEIINQSYDLTKEVANLDKETFAKYTNEMYSLTLQFSQDISSIATQKLQKCLSKTLGLI